MQLCGHCLDKLVMIAGEFKIQIEIIKFTAAPRFQVAS